jgi:subtilisin-like proprotein convertase family protein
MASAIAGEKIPSGNDAGIVRHKPDVPADRTVSQVVPHASNPAYMRGLSSTFTFTNNAPITILDSDTPPTQASLYPSTITVSGLDGQLVGKVTVNLYGLTHAYPDDIDMMLVSPSGSRVVLMSDVGGSGNLSAVDLELDDQAADAMPDNAQIISGSYKPTDATTGGGTESYPAPAPAPSGSVVLGTFAAIDPNGVWSLYVVDDEEFDGGTISGGWSITITPASGFANPTPIVGGNTGIPPFVSDVYPSPITVSGYVGQTITNVSVALLGYSHPFPDDFDLLLVGPMGVSVIVMSDCGGSDDAVDLTLVLDDGADTQLRDDGPLVSGIFRPNNVGSGDTWPAPAPAPGTDTLLAAFNGYDPNGVWNLYVVDDGGVNVGTFAGGWALLITTDTPLPIQLALFTGDIVNNEIKLDWSTVSEVNNYGFYVERRSEHDAVFTELPGSFIAGNGTTLEGKNYSWTDRTAGPDVYYYRLRQVDLDGGATYSYEIVVDAASVLGADNGTAPARYSLGQNYPNPFNPTTTISYSLAAASDVSMRLYNSLGEEVATILQGYMSAGPHSVAVDAFNLPSGVYHYRLTAGAFSETRKMLLVR